jgi:hypothetical protein
LPSPPPSLVAALAAPGDVVVGQDRPPPPGPGPALEAGIDSNGPQDGIRTLHDLDTINVQAALRAFQSANAKLIGGVTPQKSTPKAALDAVRTLLNPTRNQAALVALRALPELQTPDALRDLAAAALASSKPMLSLAALSIAAERWPDNAQVRFDLAGLLAWHGSVNEADALLDDVSARGGLPDQPFGITSKQGVDYLRAYVRMRQGKVAVAPRRVLLRHPHDEPPDLREHARTAGPTP